MGPNIGKSLGRIYLIGYMASGKSTIGKLLGNTIGNTFIDLDDLVSSRTDLSIADIFLLYGESTFRQLETSALFQATKTRDVVISTGGGTPCFHNNMKFMKANGICIYLEMSTHDILQRLSTEKNKRPLVSSKSKNELESYVTTHLKTRIGFYEQAELIIDANQNEAVIVTEILKFIKDKHDSN